MRPTNEQRDAAFETTSEVRKFLYSSPESGAFLYEVFKKYQFPREMYGEYVSAIGDVILGFYRKDQLSALFQIGLHIPQTTADTIVVDLRNFLAPIPDTTEPVTPPPPASPVPANTFTIPSIQQATPAPIPPQPTPSWVPPQSYSQTAEPTPKPQWETAKPIENQVPRYTKPFTEPSQQ